LTKYFNFLFRLKTKFLYKNTNFFASEEVTAAG